MEGLRESFSVPNNLFKTPLTIVPTSKLVGIRIALMQNLTFQQTQLKRESKAILNHQERQGLFLHFTSS